MVLQKNFHTLAGFHLAAAHRYHWIRWNAGQPPNHENPGIRRPLHRGIHVRNQHRYSRKKQGSPPPMMAVWEPWCVIETIYKSSLLATLYSVTPSGLKSIWISQNSTPDSDASLKVSDRHEMTADTADSCFLHHRCGLSLGCEQSILRRLYQLKPWTGFFFLTAFLW